MSAGGKNSHHFQRKRKETTQFNTIDLAPRHHVASVCRKHTQSLCHNNYSSFSSRTKIPVEALQGFFLHRLYFFWVKHLNCVFEGKQLGGGSTSEALQQGVQGSWDSFPFADGGPNKYSKKADFVQFYLNLILINALLHLYYCSPMKVCHQF